MKKTLLTLALILAGSCMTFAQDNKEVKYRRSSLYTMMIPDQNLDAEARKVILETFDAMPMPDKYNDHNLLIRNAFGVYDISVTPEEIQKIEELTGKKQSKFGKFAKNVGKGAAEVATGKEKKGALSDNEYVARLLKMFNEGNIAQEIVKKWFDYDVADSSTSWKLISERGLYSAGEEELAVAENTKSGINKIKNAAVNELLPKTFILVTRYSYLPAQEIIEMVAGPATIASAQAGGLAAVAAQKTIDELTKRIKGYFVKTSSYLFRLKWNQELCNKMKNNAKGHGYIIEKMKDRPGRTLFDIAAFEKDKEFGIEYVGKTWCYAPATLKISSNPSEDKALIERATVRATDKAMAQLQKKYEEFRAFTPVQVDDEGNCYAYIGLKEGVADGDKFDVVMPEINEEGATEYKKIASLKAVKGKVWDNRFGAGKALPGEQAEEGEGNADASLKYTSLTKSKKVMSGMLLKQTK